MQTIKTQLAHILRKTEKYTKTDMVYLAKGGFWLGIGQVASSLSAFGLAFAFANLLPPETYGAYKYILSIAAIFSLFSLPGMNEAVARAVARGDTSTIRTATHTRILWSMLGTACAIGGGMYYFFNGNTELAVALAIIGATLPIFDTWTLYNSYFTGTRNFGRQTIFHLLSQGVSVVSLIVSLLIIDNLIGILLAYFLPLALIRFFLYKNTEHYFSDGMPSQETLTYGKHLSALTILGVVAGNVDKILIWKFLGPVEVAIYAFSLAIPEQLKGPLKGVGELAFPKFAAQSPKEVKQNLPALFRKLAIYAVVLICISLAYVAAAPFIFKFLFPQYIESVAYSQVFMLASVALVSTIPLSLITAQRKIKEQYFISIVHPILQVIAFVVLIPLLGIWGAIIARLLLRAVSVILAIALVQRTFN